MSHKINAARRRKNRREEDDEEDDELESLIRKPWKHPKCKGFEIPDIGWGTEYDCEYHTNLDCDDCKYGGGKKDPNAKCNRTK